MMTRSKYPEYVYINKTCFARHWVVHPMIVGMGVDLVEITRVERIYKIYGQRFAGKFLSPAEMERIPEQPGTFLAGRFAAREAAVKALGTGFADGITPLQMEITNNNLGKPELKFFGAALDRAEAMGVQSIHISISHERAYALALVILES